MTLPVAGCGKDFRERPSDKKKLICTENYPLCPRCQAIKEMREEIQKTLNMKKAEIIEATALLQGYLRHDEYARKWLNRVEEITLSLERVLLGDKP